MNTIPIRFDLYSPISGKWKYGGISNIPENTKLWDNNFIQVVDTNQNEVTNGSVISGHYYVVTRDHEKFDKDPSYTRFFGGLFTPERIKELNNLTAQQ